MVRGSLFPLARPGLTFVVCEQQITEIWANGRASLISIRNYDFGPFDPNTCQDHDGFFYACIDWRAPAWRLGLTLKPQI